MVKFYMNIKVNKLRKFSLRNESRKFHVKLEEVSDIEEYVQRVVNQFKATHYNFRFNVIGSDTEIFIPQR